MKTENELKELKTVAYDARVALSKATAKAEYAAFEYCKCAGKVSNAYVKSYKKDDDEATRYNRKAAWDSYLAAMKISSATKDIAEETAIITLDEYNEEYFR